MSRRNPEIIIIIIISINKISRLAQVSVTANRRTHLAYRVYESDLAAIIRLRRVQMSQLLNSCHGNGAKYFREADWLMAGKDRLGEMVAEIIFK